MTATSPALVLLESPVLKAAIDPQGAQLHWLRDRSGRDFLWHGDPAVWAGRSPILFPIVGALHGGVFRLRGQRYPLSRHGFARGSAFKVVASNPSTATFRLCSSPATLAVYPFPFELDIEYGLEGAVLTVNALVKNTGRERLPASLGFHPGFPWPLPGAGAREAHWIEFEREESAPIRRIDTQGLLSPHNHPSPLAGRKLALREALFQDDVVILDRFASRRARYGGRSGPAIEIGFADARYLGIWSKPGAPFVCIEPWQGIADPAGFTGELGDKPGIFSVAAGETHAFGMTITLIE